MFLNISAIVLFAALLIQPCHATEIEFQHNAFSTQQQQKIRNWIEQSIDIVEDSLTEVPIVNYKFEIFNKRYAREPVPWAEVVRERQIIIKLHVNRNATANDFKKDWTLYHELSHLYLPYLDYPSFWINEGFATYMQYIAMLKSNVINQSEYIKRVKNGFKRGATKNIEVAGKLSEVTADMWRKRAFRRVYWSGAAFFIELDNALIENGSNLAAIISKYSRCCLTDEAEGAELMQTFDKLSKSTLFSETYKRYQHRTNFPNIPDQYLQNISQFYGQDNSLSHRERGDSER